MYQVHRWRNAAWNKTVILFRYIYHTCYFRVGINLLHQSVYHSPGKYMAGRVERGFLFDKRDSWYSWCLPALWHFSLSKFVKCVQKCANFKLAIDISKKCVYNTTYASGIMSVALSHIISRCGVYLRLGISQVPIISYSRCIVAAKFSDRGTTRLESNEIWQIRKGGISCMKETL